ncbi:MAG: hypothetical protein LH631_03580 [Alkalinema sp. CAN_BIN05]|nr:hypothetical protein [Alkalinema sp. CAN_BIN05]
MLQRIWEGVLVIMADTKLGMTKTDGADSPVWVGLSTVIILGTIGFLVLWAIRSAYLFN